MFHVGRNEKRIAEPSLILILQNGALTNRQLVNFLDILTKLNFKKIYHFI